MAQSNVSQLVWQNAADYLTAPFRRYEAGFQNADGIAAPSFSGSELSFGEQFSSLSEAFRNDGSGFPSSNNALTIAQSIPADAQSRIHWSAAPREGAFGLSTSESLTNQPDAPAPNPLEPDRSSLTSSPTSESVGLTSEAVSRGQGDDGVAGAAHGESQVRVDDSKNRISNDERRGHSEELSNDRARNAERRSVERNDQHHHDGNGRQERGSSSGRDAINGSYGADSRGADPRTETGQAAAPRSAPATASGKTGAQGVASSSTTGRPGSAATQGLDFAGSRFPSDSSVETRSSGNAGNGSSKGNAAQGPNASSQSAATARADRAEQPTFVRSIMALSRTNGGSMTMKLEPESLGSLRIQMSVNQGRVTVQFHTQTTETGSLIRDSVQSLRASLESQGLRLESVTIQPLSREAASAPHGSHHSSSENGTGQGHHQQDAADGRSRGYSEHQGRRDSSNQSGGGRRDASPRDASVKMQPGFRLADDESG